MPKPHHDDLYQALSQLDIPAPRAQAQADILRAARQMPPRRRVIPQMLRQLRAYLYVPQTRYAIMACTVALFMALGLLNQAARQNAPVIPDDLLLYDIAVNELTGDNGEEDWFDGEFI